MPGSASVILLTGFEPFGDIEVNPSQVLVEQIGNTLPGFPDVQIQAEILPCRFREASERVISLLHKCNPDIMVSLGVAVRDTQLSLERIARNIDHTSLPDNAGVVLQGVPIVQDGPATYESTLPLSAMLHALREHHIPSAISEDAGTYVCNHIFYVARHQIALEKLKTRCGFIHVPLIGQGKLRNTVLSLEQLIEAILICLSTAVRGQAECL